MNIAQLVEWNDIAQTQNENVNRGCKMDRLKSERAGERRGRDMRYEEIISQTGHAVMLKTKLIA